MMTKDEILRAFDQLSPQDQQAVRSSISAAGGASCCGEEMKEHMQSMMEKMHSSDNPMEHCRQMMEMCQRMMQQKMQTS